MWRESLPCGQRRPAMRANDERSSGFLRHGAYLCLRLSPGGRLTGAAVLVPDGRARRGLRNEFEPGEGPPGDAIAFLRRIEATAGDLTDEGLERADAVVHVASASSDVVTEFCAEAERVLVAAGVVRVLRGGVRPMVYTGNAMHNFAYAHRVLPQPGRVMPNAFLLPMSKTAAWWAKGWMERHTYFLPRYDNDGKMVNEGHALASAAGIDCLMRRTYKHESEPAPAGSYDFVTYFECADDSVPVFHEVCAALRDVSRNPEWKFVREGPTWQGRRVATWPELFP